MAFKLGTLQIDLEANTAQLKRNEKQVSTITKKMEKSINLVGGAIAAAFSGRALAGMVLMADEMQVLERRIGIVSDNAIQASTNFNRLSSIATKTGQKIRDVSRIFEGFKRIQTDIRATNSELLDFTESLNQLAIIGGSSAEDTANALRQLNQGLSGGILRAEEFNSIIEGTPEIAFAIAKGLNKTVGELRQMVLDGELLASTVFESILSQTDKIAERFEEIPQSLAQVFQGAKNEMAIYISNVNEAIGLTEGLAKLFADFRDNLAKVNKENAELSKTDREEAERRLEVEIKSIQHIDDLIKSNKLNLFLQQNILAGNEDNEKALRLSLIHQEAIRDLGKQRLFFVDRVKKIEERIAEVKEEEIRDSTQILKITKEEVEEQKAKTRELERQTEIRQLRKTDFKIFGISPDSRGSGRGRFPGAGKKDDPLEPQVFGDPDIEGQVSDFLVSIGDANAKIEAEAQRHQEALLGITTFGEGQRAELQGEIDDKIAAIKAKSMASQLTTAAGFFSQINQLLVASGKEGTVLQKAVAVTMAGIQAQQIIANTLVAASGAAAFSSAAGSFAALASAQAIRAFGFAQAGIVLGLSFSGGRQFGGNVPNNALTPVTENGDPELLTQGGRQFLLGGGGGKITSGRDMEVSGGKGFQIIINNNAPGIDVQVEGRDDKRIMIAIKKAEDNAVNRVNSSISRNQGPTANALQSAGISANRRLT